MCIIASPSPMNASTISFDVWCRNHSHDHDAKWCRELYPWEIFQRIDYNRVDPEVPQPLVLGRTNYHAWVERHSVTDDARSHYFVRVRSLFSSGKQRWDQRAWNDLFHLVASSSGHFITVFTHKRDPSKVLLKKFLTGRLADGCGSSAQTVFRPFCGRFSAVESRPARFSGRQRQATPPTRLFG